MQKEWSLKGKMAIDLTPNYKAKILHVALRDQFKPVKRNLNNGLVYEPKEVYSGVNMLSERMYKDLFIAKSKVTVLSLRTEQGPGELVKKLSEEFGVVYSTFVGGIAAPFRATPEQAKRLIEDLRNNPQKYFVSEEKKEFGGMRFSSGFIEKIKWVRKH